VAIGRPDAVRYRFQHWGRGDRSRFHLPVDPFQNHHVLEWMMWEYWTRSQQVIIEFPL
jgi:hypothetical protein